ncbi:hypothetical protein IV102_26345 [bacterium]|nr:hypothetical protein [bacterium]
MKIGLVLLMLTLSLSSSGCGQSPLNYVASRRSNLFHRPDCVEAADIKPKNRIHYARREEAASDHRPCDICKP